MLKTIEIKNFESHKHTVIDNLSDALNLIRGESNVGKSSILRALQLAAYNVFDPKSVRIGESKCEVTVTTDKGTVKVIRGPKTNYWEVCPIGEKKLEFEKVGVKIVPEAARVIGLQMVHLGDKDIPVNIMNQLESHFMLASIGGEDASGSMRAQVIDEISGLSGIEGVIKDVSLDNHRLGRGIKDAEDKMEETRKQLHDDTVLQQEAAVLDETEKVLADYDSYEKACEDARTLLHDWNKDVIESNNIEDTLNAMPDIDSAKDCIESAEEASRQKKAASELETTASSVKQSIESVTARLAAMPNIKSVSVLIKTCDESVVSSAAVKKLNAEYQSVKDMIDKVTLKLEKFASIKDPTEMIAKADEIHGRLARAEALLSEAQGIMDEMIEVDEKLKSVDSQADKALKERDSILATIKVCPLTLKPISKECLEEAK